MDKQLVKAFLLIVFISINSILTAQYAPDSIWQPVAPDSIDSPDYLSFAHDTSKNVNIICISDTGAFSMPWGAGELQGPYAKIQAWNANMSKLFVGFTFVLNADDYTIDKRLDYPGGYFQDARWSNVDPDIRYFCWDDNFLRYHISTDVIDTLHNFPGYSTTIGPWEGNISADDKYVVITDENYKKAKLYDIELDIVVDSISFGGWGFDWASITPSGDYIIISNYETGKTEKYDLHFNYLGVLLDNQEHADFAYDTEGHEVIVQVIPLSMTRLDNGAYTDLLRHADFCGWVGDNPNISGHISGRNFKLPGWAIVSTPTYECENGNGYYSAGDIFAIKLDTTETIRHYGFSRSTLDWSFASVSPDGEKLTFISDWDRGGGEDSLLTYVVEYNYSLWTGNNSTDWSDNDNWAYLKTPNRMTDVEIPDSPEGGVFPETNSLLLAEANNLVIDTNAQLTIPAGKRLNVNTKLTNYGGVNGLNIKADATGVASLMHHSENVAATVESYISQDQWHMISAPINNALAGIFTDFYMYRFDETDYSWHYITDINTDLTEGLGFFIWSKSTSTGNTTVEYSGTLNSGDLTINGLSYTASQPNDKRGWNMLGNPYPSATQWNTNWIRTNVDPVAYIYDGANYLTWNAETQTGTHPNGDIAIGQGFWVKANASGASVTIPQSERKHSTQQFYKNTTENQIRITLTGNGYQDKTMIIFDEKASNDFDNQYDAWKIPGIADAPQLYSYFNGNKLTVNALNLTMDELIIPVYFEAGKNGVFTLNANDISTFSSYQKVYLKDLKENITIDLKEINTYSFKANVTDNANRFELYFTKNALSNEEIETSSIHIFSFENHIYTSNPLNIKGELIIYDLTGREMYRSRIDSDDEISFDVPAGYYIVEFYNSSIVERQKLYIK